MPDFFIELESAGLGERRELSEALDALGYDERGLLPVIAQCAESGEVLMFAWVNAESLRLTLDTGQMTYYSRSRQKLWVKGETSGNTQQVVSLTADCDGDVLLAKVRQIGPACHTGRRSCFYLNLSSDGLEVMSNPDLPAGSGEKADK